MSLRDINSSIPQVIEGQYLDQQRFMALLKHVYGTNAGKNNFRVELRLNRYKIYPDGKATQLTEVMKLRAVHNTGMLIFI
ncbi:hypothetical protein VTL71DRAFT_6237 [Oculimacula yallundae]|uniref:Uncharacterized protein n=1 Tax=Oculimacula yallundae TaxID=86028 RepID=A0ABR4BZS5_9HELO